MGDILDREALLAKARAGDRGALAALLESCGPQVRARIESKLNGPWRSVLDADDVMQVTYLEAVLRLDSFTSGGASGFVAWLTKLAENNLVDAIRSLESAKRPDPRRRVQPPAGADSYVALVDMLGVTYTTPSRHAARNEVQSHLERALHKLPPAYETVIRLYDLQGKPMSEVAEELQRSEGASYMLLARAHDRLREVLGSEAQFFSNPA